MTALVRRRSAAVANVRARLQVTRVRHFAAGHLPALWGCGYVAAGPDGQLHQAPGFWRLWFALRRAYGGAVQIPIRVDDVRPPRQDPRPHRIYNIDGR